jgi:hypothetical protein
MAKGNILKEAIADAKAVREVALANAKAALEEAFTPKLQNMLSARLSEDLDEDYYEDGDDDMDLELGEMGGDMPLTQKEKETHFSPDNDMDEEIDLEEILNELELEEGKKADDEEEDLEEAHRPHYEADEVQLVNPKAEYVAENEEFDLDSLLEEINNLDEQVPELTGRRVVPPNKKKPVHTNTTKNNMARGKQRKGMKVSAQPSIASKRKANALRKKTQMQMPAPLQEKNGCRGKEVKLAKVKKELFETKEAFDKVQNELNEVNLLNSKLLYVNRIFKANQLDETQKLRVVETLDKAESSKEAKLIYETIKNTFKVANTKKVSKKPTKKSIKENFKGMASKAAGMSRTKRTAPKRAIISESDNMVNRFQKLANIKISE